MTGRPLADGGDEEYDSWVLRHRRSHTSKAEYDLRKGVFHANRNLVESGLLAAVERRSYAMQLNQYADWTEVCPTHLAAWCSKCCANLAKRDSWPSAASMSGAAHTAVAHSCSGAAARHHPRTQPTSEQALRGLTPAPSGAQEEYRALMLPGGGLRGAVRTGPGAGEIPYERKAPRGRLPRTVDWRHAGIDAQVKDQAACGSCWVGLFPSAPQGPLVPQRTTSHARLWCPGCCVAHAMPPHVLQGTGSSTELTQFWCAGLWHHRHAAGCLLAGHW